MVATMDAAGFGGCTNIGECSAACPKEIGLHFIGRLNRDLLSATISGGSSVD
ncbi:MAG: succinate dehydrogenase/fumarate reductase iron-sulfur subunit, partial [Roseiflexaceae bacterium]